ncbi:MAG: hypothetical protein WCI88_15700 [Chloroflexota bacterium]
MMKFKQPVLKQNTIPVYLIVGIAAVVIIVLFIGVFIGLSLSPKAAPSPSSTPLPQGFAETSIVLTIASFPTDTPLPTNTPPPPPSPLPPTNTPQPTLTSTRVYIPIAVAPTDEFITLPDGTKVPASMFVDITPISSGGISKGCACTDENVTCNDFRSPRDAQNCYDLCRATTCETNECDPWGMDVADGKRDWWVCDYMNRTPHIPGGK